MTTEDDTVVAIRVSHGSLEEADYAVMVGTFEDETLGGTERFLDRQLGGLLTASYDAGSYPGTFEGHSLFIRPHPDVDRRTSPPGAYVIGLGRSVELTRSRLRHAVGRALVDRCLQIENWPADEATEGVREVGVSSTLLGVRGGDGVSVSESVPGSSKESSTPTARSPATRASREQSGTRVERVVRITELELIERFGDRADLAAMVVRRLPNTVQLGAAYVEALADVVVGRKRGGLPGRRGARRQLRRVAPLLDHVGRRRRHRAATRSRPGSGDAESSTSASSVARHAPTVSCTGSTGRWSTPSPTA